jgi:hypothetical protein
MWKSGKVNDCVQIIKVNITRDGSSLASVVSDTKIIHSPTKVVGQVESERSISVLYILNHHH